MTQFVFNHATPENAQARVLECAPRLHPRVIVHSPSRFEVHLRGCHTVKKNLKLKTALESALGVRAASVGVVFRGVV
jgi:hypothetical protein